MELYGHRLSYMSRSLLLWVKSVSEHCCRDQGIAQSVLTESHLLVPVVIDQLDLVEDGLRQQCQHEGEAFLVPAAGDGDSLRLHQSWCLCPAAVAVVPVVPLSPYEGPPFQHRDSGMISSSLSRAFP